MREISSFSLIRIFRVPGAGLSRHAGELGKYMKVSRFIKIRLNGGATTKFYDHVVFNDFKGSDY